MLAISNLFCSRGPIGGNDLCASPPACLLVLRSGVLSFVSAVAAEPDHRSSRGQDKQDVHALRTLAKRQPCGPFTQKAVPHCPVCEPHPLMASLVMCSAGLQVVQVEVQAKHVDARFSEQAEGAAFGVFLHQRANGGLREMAGGGDCVYLVERRGRRDVWIEAGCGGGDEILGYGLAGILLLISRDSRIDAIDERTVGFGQVGAAGVGGVVTVACG